MRRDAQSSCPAFDRLIGSRLLIATPRCASRCSACSSASSFYGPVPLEGVSSATRASPGRATTIRRSPTAPATSCAASARRARERVRLRDCGVRCGAAVRSQPEGVDLAIRTYAWILRHESRTQVPRVQRLGLKGYTVPEMLWNSVARLEPDGIMTRTEHDALGPSRCRPIGSGARRPSGRGNSSRSAPRVSLAASRHSRARTSEEMRGARQRILGLSSQKLQG